MDRKNVTYGFPGVYIYIYIKQTCIQLFIYSLIYYLFIYLFIYFIYLCIHSFVYLGVSDHAAVRVLVWSSAKLVEQVLGGHRREPAKMDSGSGRGAWGGRGVCFWASIQGEFVGTLAVRQNRQKCAVSSTPRSWFAPMHKPLAGSSAESELNAPSVFFQ